MNFQKIALKKLLEDQSFPLLAKLTVNNFTKTNKTIFKMIEAYYDKYNKLPTKDILIAYAKSNFKEEKAEIIEATINSLSKVDENLTDEELINELKKETIIKQLDNVAEEFIEALQEKNTNKILSLTEKIQNSVVKIDNKLPDDIRSIEFKKIGLATIPCFLPIFQKEGLDLAGLTIVGAKSGCVDEDTEYLTPKGWKKIKDFEWGDKILEVNPYDNYKAYFREPLDYIKEYDDRPAFRVKPNNRTTMSMFLTNEHTILYERDSKKKDENGRRLRNINTAKAEDFFKLNTTSGVYIPSSFIPMNTKGVSYNEFEIRFIVAFCADGNIASANRVRFNLKKDRKKERLEWLLKKLNFSYTYNHKNNGYIEYYINVKNFPLKEKGLHNYFWEANLVQLKIIADELQHWDGRVDNRTKNIQFFTSVKEEADFAQYALAAVFKKDVAIDIQNRVGKIYKTNNKLYKRKSIEYVVRVTNTSGKNVVTSNIEKIKLPNNTKYCFTTKTGFWLARKDNYIFVTGNSGKSIFSLQQALYSYKQGYKVGVLSLELPTSMILTRLYSMDTNTPYREILKNINKEIIEEWKNKTFEPNSFFIKDIRYNTTEIKKAVQYLVKQGVKLIVIDYLNLVEADHDLEEWRQLANLVKDLHAISVEHNVVILSPTQLNITVDKKGNVEATTRGARELEFSSSVFLFIFQTKEEYKENVARIIVKKARSARKLTLMTKTDFEHMKFIDLGITIEE